MFIGSIFAYEGICLFHLFFLNIFERQYKNENLDKGNNKKIVSVVLFYFEKCYFPYGQSDRHFTMADNPCENKEPQITLENRE